MSEHTRDSEDGHVWRIITRYFRECELCKRVERSRVEGYGSAARTVWVRDTVAEDG